MVESSDHAGAAPKELRAFAVVFASGGVRAAARELGVAHSAVSRHLSELESWLGVALIRESGGRKGLTFTPQGEALGRASLAGLREIAHAVDSLREARSAGSVIISTTPSFAARWLLPRLPALEEAHPRIMEDALYPVMSPALWKKSGRPATPAGLARLRLLHDRDPNASWEAWREAHGPASLDVRSGPRFASSDPVLRAALHGQGAALFARVPAPRQRQAA